MIKVTSCKAVLTWQQDFLAMLAIYSRENFSVQLLLWKVLEPILLRTMKQLALSKLLLRPKYDSKATIAFQKQKYSKSSVHFTSIISSVKVNVSVQLYNAIVFLFRPKQRIILPYPLSSVICHKSNIIKSNKERYMCCMYSHHRICCTLWFYFCS